MSFDEYVNIAIQKHKLVLSLAILKTKPENLTTNQYLAQIKDQIDDRMDTISITSEDFDINGDETDYANQLTNFDGNFKEIATNIDTRRLNNDNDIELINHKNLTDKATSQNIGPQSQITGGFKSTKHSEAKIQMKLVQTDGKATNNNIVEMNIDELGIDTSNSILITDPNIVRILNEQFGNFEPNTTELANNSRVDKRVNQKSNKLGHCEPNTTTMSHNGRVNVTRVQEAVLSGYLEPNMTQMSHNGGVDVTMEQGAEINDAIRSEGNTSIDLLKGFDLGDVDGDNHQTSQSLCQYEDIQPCYNSNTKHINNNEIFESESWNVFQKDIQNDVLSKTAANICKNLNKTVQPDGNFGRNLVNNDYCNENFGSNTKNHNNLETYYAMDNNTVNTDKNACYATDFNANCNIRASEQARHNDSHVPSTSIEKNKEARQNIDHVADFDKTGASTDTLVNANINTENYTHISQSQTQSKIAEIFVMGKRKSNDINYNDFENVATDVNKHRKLNTEDVEETEVAEAEVETEVIPFKVLEEINKIKKYLAKRSESEEYSDSGYKSDSLSKSSYKKVSQTSANGLNQSAHHLVTYLRHCQLTQATYDVNLEISEVLSKLIDTLYEQEIYPSFLEDLFETINQSLTDIHESRSDGENNLLKQDDTIQRLCLLNESIHILQFTIEKITLILDSTYEETVSEKHSEITSIDKVENLTYIFHLLETFIKRYLRSKDVLTENSSQASQESEKLYKQSTISEIWRRKWNPTKKEEPLSNSTQKNVLSKCSEVLNKYIVDFINSYSLVAYTALQCFNLLQK